MASETPLMPYFAGLDQLERCLDLLDGRPLKLVAGDRRSGPAFREIPWDQPEWRFSIAGDQVVKPLLLNQEDSFQFSIAGPTSKQDWHYHSRTFEIFVSTAPMRLDYRSTEKGVQALTVDQGVLIVPPGLAHKITLSGTAFVFQAMVGGENLGEDKMIVPEEG